MAPAETAPQDGGGGGTAAQAFCISSLSINGERFLRTKASPLSPVVGPLFKWAMTRGGKSGHVFPVCEPHV